jgi:hypothetical protein
MSYRSLTTTLLVSLACLGLGACGKSSNKPPSSAAAAATTTAAPTTTTPTPATTTTSTAPPAASVPGTPAYKRYRALVLAVIACSRAHGIYIPEPNASNGINLSKVNLTGGRQEIVNACYRKIVKKTELAEAKRKKK